MGRGDGDNLAALGRPRTPSTAAGGAPARMATDEYGRNLGLLHRWRKVASGWQGYVTHPVRDGGGWVLVDEWLPAAQLAQA